MKSFKDILSERRKEFSNFIWVSRKLETILSYRQNKRSDPTTHKNEVFSSQRMREIIAKISQETGQREEALKVVVKCILDEIGFNKQLKIIRWLGLILAKINQKVYTGIYVNEDSINRLKSAMGSCPVIFAPSHRSYADFILMSYICFTYDIEIPAIAAGMDFHAMWGMGSILRDTGAFFMRRSFNNDALYWETFKQYVHQIVSKGDLPIEFFIEGTRSRSCKSLIPKFGLLSMILKPLFTGEVPDILIVPINISYDRVLEEKLFAFELLGIPKPKESTSGFFKSLSIIKENYGNIYVDFTSPISAKQYFGEKLNRIQHCIGPLHHQQLNSEDKAVINDIGYEILCTQRQNTVLMPFNLAAVFLSNNLTVPCLMDNMNWLRNVLETLGARVASGTFDDALKVHKGLVQVNEKGEIELIRNAINLNNINSEKLKAYRLSNETMTYIIPSIMLQLYVNPLLHYFSNCCLIIISIFANGHDGRIFKDDLFHYFRFLRTIFSFEFIFHNKNDEMVFEKTLQDLKMLNVIEISNNNLYLGTNERLQNLLLNLLNPFILAYMTMSYILVKSETVLIDHKTLLTECQKHLESVFIVDKNIHPYAFNLDTLTICLQSFSSFGALEKIKENEIKYKVNFEELNKISSKLGMIQCRNFAQIKAKL